MADEQVVNSAELNKLFEGATMARRILAADLSHLSQAEAISAREEASRYLALSQELLTLLDQHDEHLENIKTVKEVLVKSKKAFWEYSFRNKVRFTCIYIFQVIPAKVFRKLRIK